MSWQDLAISPLSSVRMPGLALFSVFYSDEGVVKMCATSAATRILLIRTRNSTYGITPADEELFVNALMKKMRG
jgi:hypothetical protein